MPTIQPRGNQRPAGNEWMVVYVTHAQTDAHIVAGRLHHEGIPAMVDHAIGAQSIGITIGNMGEVRVLVRPQDYETALDILEPAAPDELSDSTDRVQYLFDDDDDEAAEDAEAVEDDGNGQ